MVRRGQDSRGAAGPRVRRVLPLLLALLLAGCFLVPTSPDVPYTRVTVQVVDEDGAPVPGARVEAWGGLRRTERRNVDFTGQAGEVSFSLPPARYDMYAHPPAGYTHVAPLLDTHAEVYADPASPAPTVTLVLARSS